MRTAQEIVEYYREHRDDVLLGFSAGPLLGYLSPKERLEFDESEEYPIEELSESAVIAKMRGRMEYAWDKATSHKSLSASLNIEVLTCFLWLLGNDELVEFANDENNYAMYGAPILKRVCGEYGLLTPTTHLLKIQRMSLGLPC